MDNYIYSYIYNKFKNPLKELITIDCVYKIINDSIEINRNFIGISDNRFKIFNFNTIKINELIKLDIINHKLICISTITHNKFKIIEILNLTSYKPKIDCLYESKYPNYINKCLSSIIHNERIKIINSDLKINNIKYSDLIELLCDKCILIN